MRLYTDKGYYRDGSGRYSEFLAPNYRISELCSAVAIAQLDKLNYITERRNQIAQQINETLECIKGLYPMQTQPGSFCSYWFYPVRLEEKEFGAPRDTFIDAMNAEGIQCSGSHTPTPLYDYGVFKNLNAFPTAKYPFSSKDFCSNYSYDQPNCPNSQALLDKTVILIINEFYSGEDIEDICSAIRKIAYYFQVGRISSIVKSEYIISENHPQLLRR